MKLSHYTILLATALFVACGGSESSLAEKKAQLAELKAQVAELETEIAALDTTNAVVKNIKLVTTKTLESQPFKHYIEIQGEAESDQNIMVTSDMGGIATSINVKEGQYVRKGELLAQLDNTVLLGNLQEVESGLALAQTVYARKQRLFEKKIGSEIDLLQSRNNVDQLEAKKIALQGQIDKTQIVSPINGRVDAINIKKGELLSPGRGGIRVTNLNTIKIEADLSEAFIGKVKAGDRVQVNFPVTGITKQGQIRSVGQTINATNRSVKVVVIVANQDQSVKANMLARIKVNDQTINNAIVVPRKLVQQYKGKDYVFTVGKESNQMVAKRSFVEPSLTYEGQTAIKSGLKAGDQIIVDGYREVSAEGAIQIK